MSLFDSASKLAHSKRFASSEAPCGHGGTRSTPSLGPGGTGLFSWRWDQALPRLAALLIKGEPVSPRQATTVAVLRRAINAAEPVGMGSPVIAQEPGKSRACGKAMKPAARSSLKEDTQREGRSPAWPNSPLRLRSRQCQGLRQGLVRQHPKWSFPALLGRDGEGDLLNPLPPDQIQHADHSPVGGVLVPADVHRHVGVQPILVGQVDV